MFTKVTRHVRNKQAPQKWTPCGAWSLCDPLQHVKKKKITAHTIRIWSQLSKQTFKQMSDNSTQKRATKQPADHPKYAEMITAAIVALKERNGSSRQAIEKYVKANCKVGDKASMSIKAALKRGASNGHFIHTTGVRALGSFNVNEEKTEKKGGRQRVRACLVRALHLKAGGHGSRSDH